MTHGETVARSRRLSDDVIVDFDARDGVIGIEFLAFDDAALDRGRRFAQDNKLGFPTNLAGALVAKSEIV
ncbi:MAG: DUF2283 domain-containing protein [Candidatus Eremiobacteraeota bacterium]|nr:DUF2283 domain-containing protein [Candidatus Eremiobacteraeota bacterium]MBC5825111.1 DUF2283 domain-containing protein [Candidatus Eremiobacteraeota bacterium]